MSNPWMKFYPSDWRADPALRVCSIAARGLWMEMLCLMHEATPRGSLLVNGKPVSDRMLANLCGLPARDAAALIAELEEAGVFSRDADGTIYSRRIRRDDAKAEEGRKQVSKRWRDAPDSDVGPTVQPNRNPNGSPNRSPPSRPITQKPEARSQNGEREARAHESAEEPRVRIAAEVLASKGLGLDAQEATGLIHQVQCWLNEEIPKDFIVATAIRVMAKLPDFSVAYLITAMRNEWRKACEQPAIRAEKPHAKTTENQSVSAALRGLTAEFERSESEALTLCDDPGRLLPKGHLQ